MHSMNRRLVLTCGLMLVVAWVGCSQETEPMGSPIETAWEKPQPTAAKQQPTAQASGSKVEAASESATPQAADQPVGHTVPIEEIIAVVNGEPINRNKFMQMLVDSHGPAILEQMILLTAAKQNAAAKSLEVTASDIRAAEDEALKRIAAPMGDPEAAALDRHTAERLLADFLQIKGLSRTEWDCRMEQRAYITKIAQAEVAAMPITEEMLKEEYALAYGERVQIRLIQSASQAAVNRAASMLKEKPFEEVARQISENAISREQGGLMPPFTAQDGAVPPLIRARAFAMQIGETSEPLREGAWYHIIRIERRFPASEVGFENVDHQALGKRLTDRLVRQRIDTLDSELFRDARIEIRDRGLEKQFRRKHPG